MSDLDRCRPKFTDLSDFTRLHGISGPLPSAAFNSVWTRANIIAEARSWLGVKWDHQQRIRAGADCRGLIGGIGLALGMSSAIAWERDTEAHCYGLTPDSDRLLAIAAKYLRPIDLRAATLADILVLRWSLTGPPQHFALISGLNPTTIIHSYRGRGVVENNIGDRYKNTVPWSDLIHSAWSYREVV